jgi:hypothetical protein
VLQDGIFSNQKSKFRLILESLTRKEVGIFSAIWSILRPNVTFFGDMVHLCYARGIFFPILVFCTEKNLTTLVVKPQVNRRNNHKNLFL